MNKSPQLDPDDLRAWAAERLGVPADATADRICEVFLRSLRDDSFVPPPQVPDALHVLLHPNHVDLLQLNEGQAFEIEDRLRNEIESFAFEFFQLPFERRQERLQTLTNRCAWNAPLAAWLRRLRKGLFLDPHAIEATDNVRTLAAAVAELFVYPPAARVVHRPIVLRRLGGELRTWRRAAAVLQRDFPKIAALEPDLMEELTEPAAATTLPAQPRRTNMPASSPATPLRSGSAWWVIWLAIFILAGIFRAASTNLQRTPTIPPNAPRINFPQQQRHDLEEIRKWLDEQERQQLLPQPPRNPFDP